MPDSSKPVTKAAPGSPEAANGVQAGAQAGAAATAGRTGTRQPLVVGNWKMNGDLAGNERLLGALRAQLDRALLDRVGVAVCPPFPFISQAATWLGDTGARWGAQDVAAQEDGAYTGEVSARMLADLRCTWTLVGHSERRRLFGDTDEVVAQKVERALVHGLRPIVCLGETLEERQSAVTEEIGRAHV